MSTISSPFQREPELLGQTVVVIGGSAGIGFETARRARVEGAKVILTGRNAERLQHAAGQVDTLSTAVHTTGGREGPRLRRHCCKTSLAKPRALAAWCMESQAFRSAPRSSWKSFLS